MPWAEERFHNRLALLLSLLRHGVDPNQGTSSTSTNDPLSNAPISEHLYSLKAPVLWWVWLAALRECGYSLTADQGTGTFEVVKSAKEVFVGKSILEKEYVISVPYFCRDSN